MTLLSAYRLGSFFAALLILSACGQPQQSLGITATNQVVAAQASTAPPIQAAEGGPGAVATPQPNGPQGGIDNFTFIPATLTVPVGATVTWTNHDDIPHTVTATDKRFSSTGLDTDDQFAYRFTVAGTYTYFCTLHAKMTGKVIVQ